MRCQQPLNFAWCFYKLQQQVLLILICQLVSSNNIIFIIAKIIAVRDTNQYVVVKWKPEKIDHADAAL